MIFRLKVLIPLLLSVVAIVVLGYVFKLTMLRGYMESQWPIPQTALRLDELHLSFGGNLEFSSAGKVIQPARQRTLIGWAQTRLVIHSDPLGFSRVYVENMTIEGLEIKQALLDGGDAVTSPETDTPVEGTDSPFPQIDFKDFDHRAILERVTGSDQLESEKKIEILRLNVEKLSVKWKDRYDETLKRSDALSGEFEALKGKWADSQQIAEIQPAFENLRKEFDALRQQKFSVDNIDQIAGNAKRARDLKNQADTLIEKVSSLKSNLQGDLKQVENFKNEVQNLGQVGTELQQDLDQVRQQAEDVRTSAKTDLELLKRELDPGNFGAGKITRLLFGKAWEEKLESWLAMYDHIIDYLPKTSSGEADAGKTEKIKVKELPPVLFKRDRDWPQWTVEHLRLSGTTPDNGAGQPTFEGSIFDISADESILGRPTRWDIKGTLGQQQGHFKLTGTFSTLVFDRDNRHLHLEVRDHPLGKHTWGPPDICMDIAGGKLRIDMEADMSRSPELNITGELLFEELEIQPAASVKDSLREPLKQALSNALTSPVHFEVKHRPHQKPSFTLHSKLDEAFKEAFRSFIEQRLAEEQVKLTAKFNEGIEKKISELAGDAGPLAPLLQKLGAGLLERQNLLGAGVGQLSGLLTGRSGELDNLQKDGDGLAGGFGGLDVERQNLEQTLKQQLKQKLEDDVKKKAEEEARQRLQQVIQPNAAEGQPGPAPAGEAIEEIKKEQKQKLKDKIKLPF